jgi:hypothetical protein
MKKIFIFVTTVLLLSTMRLSAGVIQIDGSYQGKNLYVQNPFAGSGVGFCTIEVLVNDIKSTDEIQSSAYEIDFANFKLNIGDKVVVRLKHKDDCKPKILNPEVLKPKSTFEMLSIKADENMLKWTSKGEGGPLPYIVEQFRWSKWVKVGEVPGKGDPSQHEYSYKLRHHSGMNKYRVQQTDFTGKPNTSAPVQFNSTSPALAFTPAKASKDIYFQTPDKKAAETMFEIYDSYGNLVKKGFDKQVDISGLAKGVYYLNYDNKTDKFIKK